MKYGYNWSLLWKPPSDPQGAALAGPQTDMLGFVHSFVIGWALTALLDLDPHLSLAEHT